MSIVAYTHGIFPRSERVVRATRDRERGRAGQEEVDESYRAELTDLVNLQRDAGLDLFSDGLLGWQDIFRPLVEACDGLQPGPLVRWFDTNSFYRAPVANRAPSLRRRPSSVVDASVPLPRVATLPSPFLFSRVAHSPPGETLDRDRLMYQLAVSVLRPVAEDVVREGCRLIHLEDPWLTYHGVDGHGVDGRGVDGDGWGALERALDAFRAGLGVPVVLHTSFGDAAPVLERLRRLPVDAIGVDLVATDVNDLGHDWEVGLVAGCLSGRSSLVESVDLTVKVASVAAEVADPPVLYLSSGTSLELVPETVARQKVQVLGESARQLKELSP